MKNKAVRGAITIDKNDEICLKNDTKTLLGELLKVNKIDVKDILYVIFSSTKDIDCAYPAKFAREIDGFSNIPLMCFMEQDVKNSLPLCVRVLIVLKVEKELKPVYLKEAKKLRPDLLN